MNVVFTYDFRSTEYKEFIERKYVLGPLNSAIFATLEFDEGLGNSFANNGVTVQMLQNQSGRKNVAEILPTLASADIIFHRTGWVAYKVKDDSRREKHQRVMDDVLREKFLSKTHYHGRYPFSEDKQVAAAIARKAGIPMPLSWTIDDYLDSDEPLPVVLKARDSACGDGIFFIENPRQLSTFFSKQLNKQCDNRRPPSKKNYEIQEFIVTPSEHYTSYRIFTTADGAILGAVLNASANKKTDYERIEEPGPFGAGCHIYNCIDSPLYLGCKKIVSNHAQGGTQIPLAKTSNSKPLTKTDSQVLIAHGIEAKHPTLPSNLASLARKVARLFSGYGVQYAGQDWVQDEQGRTYFLEINSGPGLEIFNTLYNKGKGNQKTASKLAAQKIAEALTHAFC